MTKIVSIQSEALLIQEILGGKKEKFSLLYNRYYKDIFLITLRYSKDRNQAEDYLQDSFIAIFKSLKTYNKDKSLFLTWAKRITVNTCLQDIRKKKIKFVADDLLSSLNVSSKSMNPEQELTLKEMTSLIQQLPLGYRTIFNMYIIDGFNHGEIAEILKINESTSKSQLHKAKRKLRGLLNENNLMFQYG